jgi:phytoene/squalene synthetase
MAADLTNTFASDYVEAIHDQNAAVAGAGLSIPAGVVNWKGLRDIARDVGLDVDRGRSYLVAQYPPE